MLAGLDFLLPTWDVTAMRRYFLQAALLVFSVSAHGANSNKDPNPMPQGSQFATRAQVDSLPGITGGLSAFSHVQAEIRANEPWRIAAREERRAKNAEADAYLAASSPHTGIDESAAKQSYQNYMDGLVHDSRNLSGGWDSGVPNMIGMGAPVPASNAGQVIPIVNGNGGVAIGIGGG